MSIDAMLRIEREIPGPPAAVYNAWTDPAILARWWGPPGYTVPDCTIDVSVGGAYAITMLSPEGKEIQIAGQFRTLESPRRIVMSWAWRQDDGSYGHESEVDIAFAASATGTLLTLTHRHFDTEDARDGHNRGWGYTLDKLDAHFSDQS